MTFVIAASKLWTCWNSPILTPGHLCEHHPSHICQRRHKPSKSLVGFCSIQENGVKGSSTIWETAVRKKEKTSQERSMFFFRFFGDFDKSEGEDAKRTGASLLSQASGMCVQPFSSRNVGCPPATLLVVPRQPLRVSGGVTPTAAPFCCHWRSLQLGFTAQHWWQRAKPLVSPALSLADLSHVPSLGLCVPSGFLGLLDVVRQKWNCLNLAELRNAKKIKQTGVLLGDTGCCWG